MVNDGVVASPQEMVKVEAPVATPKGFEMVQLEVLDPIGVVHYMFGEGGVKIEPNVINQFWDHHRAVGSPWAVHSDASRDDVPLGLFGDAVKYRQKSYGKPEKMLAVFLNAPLWRPKLARASRWLLFAIPEKNLYMHHTLDAVFRRIVWSLNVLREGLFPTCGPAGEPLSRKQAARAGQPICRGLRFTITELRGDWLYHRQVFRFRSSWQSGSKAPVCFFCPAYSKGADSWLNFEDTSPLWAKQYSLTKWMVEELPPDPCSLPVLR